MIDNHKYSHNKCSIIHTRPSYAQDTTLYLPVHLLNEKCCSVQFSGSIPVHPIALLDSPSCSVSLLPQLPIT